MKKPIIVFLMLIFAIGYAWNYSELTRENIPVNDMVIDIALYDNKVYLLTAGCSIIEKTSSGIKITKHNNRDNFYIIKNGDSSQIYDDNKRIYLTANKNNSYICYFDSSYSSRIIRKSITNQEEDIFAFITGYPAGIKSSNNKLWYLCNTSDINTSSTIICYDINTAKIINQTTIPIFDAKGLAIDDRGVFYTYENKSNALIKFIINRSNNDVQNK